VASGAPRRPIPDGHIFRQPWSAGSTDQRRDRVIYYKYRADWARRALRGIDEQIAKAEKAVAGEAPVKRNRFIRLHGGTCTRQPPAGGQSHAAGRNRGYITNIENPTAQLVIDAYDRLSKSRSRSACPSTTSRPGRSTSTSANRSTRT
jgi:hypothetical protein